MFNSKFKLSKKFNISLVPIIYQKVCHTSLLFLTILGTLEKVFEVLQELRLVSGKAFISWEKSSDDLIPENNKNKAEYVKQVDNFLQRMKSNPQLDDEGEGEDGGEDDDQEDMEE